MVDVEKLKNTIPTPNWISWKNKRTVTLNQALLLCMNVCPKWYEAREDKDKFLSNLTIWSQYRLYFEDAHDWASGSGWVIEYLAEEDIQEDDFVDLKKFARWACKDVEWNGIPTEFKAIATDGDMTPIDGITKFKLSWGLKPLSEIQRMNGYRAVLYQTLQKMYNEGKSAPPTPHEVLDSWRIEFKDQPKDCKIYVLSKSFEYLNEMGIKKVVDIKSLKDAIQRLIITD